MKFNNKVYFNRFRTFFRFLESAFIEIKNITWPNLSEVLRFTVIIIIVVIFLSFILWLLDLFFVKFLNWLIL